MRILLVSNMYPDEKHPSYGIFVKRFTDELDILGIQYQKSVMHKHDGIFGKVVGYVLFYAGTFAKVIFGKYDLVYVHQASHSSPPVIAAYKFRKPKIYTNVHGCDAAPENQEQMKMQKFTRSILKISERVIVPSEYYADFVKKRFGVNRDRVYIYPSAGINGSVFYEKGSGEKKRIREKYHMNQEAPVFGMAGRISEGKGWDTFVDAIAMVKKEGIKASFVIVGSGREDDELKKLIKDRNLETDIMRIGLLPQDELCDFYNAIDYFVFPTRRESESLGLVALEAMACGTPVIASDFAAPKYYVQEGINGYKFAVNTPEQLANIICRCCGSQNENEYQKLHDGAIETAKRYSNDSIRRNLEDALKI